MTRLRTLTNRNPLGWPQLGARVELLREDGAPEGIYGRLIGFGTVCNGTDGFESVGLVDIEPEFYYHGTDRSTAGGYPQVLSPVLHSLTAVVTVAISVDQLRPDQAALAPEA